MKQIVCLRWASVSNCRRSSEDYQTPGGGAPSLLTYYVSVCVSPIRQTLLFSATLPKLIVEFARAGIHVLYMFILFPLTPSLPGLRDPSLIRLDVDNKLSDQLKTSFISVRSEDKPGIPPPPVMVSTLTLISCSSSPSSAPLSGLRP